MRSKEEESEYEDDEDEEEGRPKRRFFSLKFFGPLTAYILGFFLIKHWVSPPKPAPPVVEATPAPTAEFTGRGYVFNPKHPAPLVIKPQSSGAPKHGQIVDVPTESNGVGIGPSRPIDVPAGGAPQPGGNTNTSGQTHTAAQPNRNSGETDGVASNPASSSHDPDIGGPAPRGYHDAPSNAGAPRGYNDSNNVSGPPRGYKDDNNKGGAPAGY